MAIVGLIVGIILLGILGGIVIYIVGRLGLGIEVDGFGPAFIAALVVAAIGYALSAIAVQLGISAGGGLVGAIIHLIVAALVLMLAGDLVRGLRVKGFSGALIAAIAIGVVGWLVSLVLVALGVG